mmetsp:Transcript_8976/g.20046  ORF Transcript_8976/g.20046 Transcript_8976/m.20046 type:complete len:229 (-) Transcript_8976:478-1164(-)
MHASAAPAFRAASRSPTCSSARQRYLSTGIRIVLPQEIPRRTHRPHGSLTRATKSRMPCSTPCRSTRPRQRGCNRSVPSGSPTSRRTTRRAARLRAVIASTMRRARARRILMTTRAGAIRRSSTAKRALKTDQTLVTSLSTRKRLSVRCTIVKAALHNPVVKALPRRIVLALRTKGNVLFSIFLSSERTELWKSALRCHLSLPGSDTSQRESTRSAWACVGFADALWA